LTPSYLSFPLPICCTISQLRVLMILYFIYIAMVTCKSTSKHIESGMTNSIAKSADYFQLERVPFLVAISLLHMFKFNLSHSKQPIYRGFDLTITISHLVFPNFIDVCFFYFDIAWRLKTPNRIHSCVKDVRNSSQVLYCTYK